VIVGGVIVYKNRREGGGGMALTSVDCSAVSLISGNFSDSSFFITAGNGFVLNESL
jgi:hypothetical protein